MPPVTFDSAAESGFNIPDDSSLSLLFSILFGTLFGLCYICRPFIIDTAVIRDAFFSHVRKAKLCERQRLVKSDFFLVVDAWLRPFLQCLTPVQLFHRCLLHSQELLGATEILKMKSLHESLLWYQNPIQRRICERNLRYRFADC